MYPISTRVHVRTRRSRRRWRAGRAGGARADRRLGRPDQSRAPRPARAGPRASSAPSGRRCSPCPGNHDLPYTFPARFTSPWAEFERRWETTEPTHASPALHVVGLNSARPYRHQGGALRDDAAARRGRAAREARRGRVPRRRPAPPHARRAVASGAQEAGVAAATGAARARRGGRRPDPRRAHPPGGNERAARVRGRGRRRARGRRLDRARARAAAPEPARRGARPARLRGRRADAHACRPTSGAAATGASRRGGCSRAGSACSQRSS